MSIFNFQRFKQSRSPAKEITNPDPKPDPADFYCPDKKIFPNPKQWRQLPHLLQKRELLILRLCALSIFLSLAFMGSWYILLNRVDLPTVGGEYTEGLVGEPQFINPLYATASDVDADLTRLVYSGLLKWDQQDGLVNDLAQTMEVFDNGATYVFRIRDDARFHNGEPVRARDVIFTIEAIKNPLYRSPLALVFRNLQTTQIDDKTLELKSTEPFASFLPNLTVGILPAEIWGQYPPKSAQLVALNLEPIGSGPYRFSEFTKNKKGSIHSYTLKRNPDFYGPGPFLETITFKFYPDPAAAVLALANRNIEGLGYVPPDRLAEVSALRGLNLYYPLISRQTVIFFNQEKQPLLKSRELRQALALSIDKKTLINSELAGRHQILDGPFLAGELREGGEPEKIPFDMGIANSLLNEAKLPWPQNRPFRILNEADDDSASTPEASENDLRLTLTTINSYELIQVAEAIKKNWADIGVDVKLDIIEQNELFSRVIQPRDFEILLITLVTGSDPDPFAFWHSSQIKGDGLNLANYANRKADALLEEARMQTAWEERLIRYRQFQQILAEDWPAVFLFQSGYPYAVADKIKNISLEKIIRPSDRFQNIENWYSKTKKQLR